MGYVSVMLHNLTYRSGPGGLRLLIISLILSVDMANMYILLKYICSLHLSEGFMLFAGKNCNGWEVCWTDRFLLICSEGKIVEAVMN